MLYLKLSTASQSVVIGPFVDSTDGVTAETGLTINNTDVRLSKNGANIVGKNSGGGTHDENGYYTITLDATDTDTVGRLQLHVNATGALPVYHEFQVLEEALYDSIYGSGAARIPADVTAISGDTTAADNLESYTDGTTPMPVNATQISGDGAAADNLEAAFDDTAGQITHMGIVDQGTAQSATSTTLVLRSAAAFADDELNGATIVITGGSTGVGQSRRITDYTGSTDTATVDAWTTTPSGTITYKIYGTPPGTGSGATAQEVWEYSTRVLTAGTNLNDLDAADVRSAVGMASANLDMQLDALPTAAEIRSEIDSNSTQFASLASGLIEGAAATGTLSTTQATTNLTGYADDQLIGRIITWTSGDCEGEQTDITDSANTGGLLTFTALTTAPGDGDTFKIT